MLSVTESGQYRETNNRKIYKEDKIVIGPLKKQWSEKDFSDQVVKKFLGQSELKQRPKGNKELRKDLGKEISKLSKQQ